MIRLFAMSAATLLLGGGAAYLTPVSPADAPTPSESGSSATSATKFGSSGAFLKTVSAVLNQPLAPDAKAARTPAAEWGPGSDEAIRIALERGAEIRAARRESGEIVIAPIETLLERRLAARAAAAETEAAEKAAARALVVWRVSGDRVNLRAGPGTSHRVIGQASLGDRLVPVSDPYSRWIEIRLPGAETAWIFGTYLERAGRG